MKSQQPVLADLPLSPQYLSEAFNLKERQEAQLSVKEEFERRYNIEEPEEV